MTPPRTQRHRSRLSTLAILLGAGVCLAAAQLPAQHGPRFHNRDFRGSWAFWVEGEVTAGPDHGPPDRGWQHRIGRPWPRDIRIPHRQHRWDGTRQTDRDRQVHDPPQRHRHNRVHDDNAGFTTGHGALRDRVVRPAQSHLDLPGSWGHGFRRRPASQPPQKTVPEFGLSGAIRIRRPRHLRSCERGGYRVAQRGWSWPDHVEQENRELRRHNERGHRRRHLRDSPRWNRKP